MAEKIQFISTEINEKIKEDFVFVSYCQTNEKVIELVKKMAVFLELRGINVVYDKGGLMGGEELEEFQKLILHNNCKKVLVVCDKYYFERANNEVVGVGKEYKYIYSDYSEATASKYLAITIDKNRNSIVPIFESKISLDIVENTDIAMCCDNVLQTDKKKCSLISKEVDELYRDADSLSTHGDFISALKKINLAILMSQDLRKNLSLKCKLYNLKLYIQIKGDCYDDTTRQAVEFLKDNIGKGSLAASTRAIGYHNCSIVYDYCSDEIEAEHCAKKAYNIALKYGIDEQYTYALHLSNLYYKYKEYSKSLKVITEAKNIFYISNSDLNSLTPYEYSWYFKICVTECGLLVENANAMSGGKKNKAWETMVNASNQLVKLLFECRYDELLNDEECVELYKQVSEIFKKLSEYKKNEV